jgi:hypothetical protein
LGAVVVTLESAGLDKLLVKESVGGKLERETVIDLAEISEEKIYAAIGAIVFGRIAMREAQSFSGDFIANAHKHAEAMAESNHPDFLHMAFLSASTRASTCSDASALDDAEKFLTQAAVKGHTEAILSLQAWPAHKKLMLKHISGRNSGNES